MSGGDGPTAAPTDDRRNYDVPVTSSLPQTPSESSGPQAGLATIELVVEGMHCGSCVALIQESLAEQAGVSEARVDLDSGRAVVHYDPDQLGPDDLSATVAEAGYSAIPVS